MTEDLAGNRVVQTVTSGAAANTDRELWREREEYGPHEECPLNWGAEPDEYAKQFLAALEARDAEKANELTEHKLIAKDIELAAARLAQWEADVKALEMELGNCPRGMSWAEQFDGWRKAIDFLKSRRPA